LTHRASANLERHLSNQRHLTTMCAISVMRRPMGFEQEFILTVMQFTSHQSEAESPKSGELTVFSTVSTGTISQ
jgi:hypothetical protein